MFNFCFNKETLSKRINIFKKSRTPKIN